MTPQSLTGVERDDPPLPGALGSGTSPCPPASPLPPAPTVPPSPADAHGRGPRSRAPASESGGRARTERSFVTQGLTRSSGQAPLQVGEGGPGRTGQQPAGFWGRNDRREQVTGRQGSEGRGKQCRRRTWRMFLNVTWFWRFPLSLLPFSFFSVPPHPPHPPLLPRCPPPLPPPPPPQRHCLCV